MTSLSSTTAFSLKLTAYLKHCFSLSKRSIAEENGSGRFKTLMRSLYMEGKEEESCAARVFLQLALAPGENIF